MTLVIYAASGGNRQSQHHRDTVCEHPIRRRVKHTNFTMGCGITTTRFIVFAVNILIFVSKSNYALEENE